MRWLEREPLPRARSGASVVATGDGRVLVFGGEGDDPGAAWMGDPRADRWDEADRLPTPRGGIATLARPDGGVLAVGGRIGSTVTRVTEWFHPWSEVWVRLDDLRRPRHGARLVLTEDEAVLCVGGWDEAGPVDGVERWDPPTGCWSPSAAEVPERGLPEAPEGALVVPLAGGVLVVGGGVGGRPTDRVILWTPDGPIEGPRWPQPVRRAGIGVLHDGSVLVVGGEEADGPTDAVWWLRGLPGGAQPSQA